METVLSLRVGARAECGGEETWLSAARAGEPWALERFYNSYQSQVYALCHRVLSRSEDAKDATQSTFVRAFRELPRFRGESTAKTWIYRIAINEALSMLRKRRDVPLPTDDPLPSPCGGPSIVEKLAVEDALSRTRPAHRTILVLRFWEELSYEEIAQVLGISLSAVKMRLLRARDDFRKCYQEAR
jgi:RNA polymerase sigma-70 factor, ECF subfamily